MSENNDNDDLSFNQEYICYSVSMCPSVRDDLEDGGQIVMPPSAYEILTELNIVDDPVLFKLTNRGSDTYTHCGVSKFVAEEGGVYLPQWMMNTLLLADGDPIFIENISLPVATFLKFRPIFPDFLKIVNPIRALRDALENYPCLTTGDLIVVKDHERSFELYVLETQPEFAVEIVQSDSELEGDEMIIELVGYIDIYKEFRREDTQNILETVVNDDNETVEQEFPHSNIDTGTQQRGIPDYSYEVGTLEFFRNKKPLPKQPAEEFKPFSGRGYRLGRE